MTAHIYPQHPDTVLAASPLRVAADLWWGQPLHGVTVYTCRARRRLAHNL